MLLDVDILHVTVSVISREKDAVTVSFELYKMVRIEVLVAVRDRLPTRDGRG